MSADGTILLGYDGSAAAAAALDWAVSEARAQDEPLHVLYVASDLSGADPLGASPLSVPLREGLPPVDAEQLLRLATERAAGSGVVVKTSTEFGVPARVLVARSADAGLLVIGSRGLGSATSMVLGSSVIHVTAHARCPVAVVHPGGVPEGPVVVGVDGSRASAEPLGWAFDFAARHARPLEVLHAYAIPVYPGVVPYVPPVELTESVHDFAERTAYEVLAGWRERYPEVAATVTVVHNRPGPALIEASARGSVTIVGSRGRGAFRGMLLGSTSQALLHHAQGTVIVVPPHSTER